MRLDLGEFSDLVVTQASPVPRDSPVEPDLPDPQEVAATRVWSEVPASQASRVRSAIEGRRAQLDSQVDKAALDSQDRKEDVDSPDSLVQSDLPGLRGRSESRDSRDLSAREVRTVRLALLDLRVRLVIRDLQEAEDLLDQQDLPAARDHRVWLDSQEKPDLLDFRDLQDYLVRFAHVDVVDWLGCESSYSLNIAFMNLTFLDS